MAHVNDSLCLLVQVESKTALDNLDEILGVEGIDGVFIGPADLSASLGYPDNAGHPEVQRIIETSIRRIRAAGKAAGFLAVAPSWGCPVPDCVEEGPLRWKTSSVPSFPGCAAAPGR